MQRGNDTVKQLEQNPRRHTVPANHASAKFTTSNGTATALSTRA
jgi:hypothetical protein